MLLSSISFTNRFTGSTVITLFENVPLSYNPACLLKIVNRKCQATVILKLSFMLTKQVLLLHVSMSGFLCESLSVQQNSSYSLKKSSLNSSVTNYYASFYPLSCPSKILIPQRLPVIPM